MAVEELRAEIKNKNIKMIEVANAIGIDESTFYRKLNKGNFTLKEALAMKTYLDLTNEKAIQIFLS